MTTDDEIWVAATAYIPPHGRIATHRLSDLEALADFSDRNVGRGRARTAAERKTRLAELDALVERTTANARYVDATSLAGLPLLQAGGATTEAKPPKTMAQAATAFWDGYAARHGRTAPEADGVDRSVAPGRTPGHEAVARMVDAKRRP